MCVFSSLCPTKTERGEIHTHTYMAAKPTKEKRKSTFGMRLAKCLKSRLTEKKEEIKTRQEKQHSFLVVVLLLLLFFSVIRFVFHVRHSVGTKSDVCVKKESLPRSFLRKSDYSCDVISWFKTLCPPTRLSVVVVLVGKCGDSLTQLFSGE